MYVLQEITFGSYEHLKNFASEVLRISTLLPFPPVFSRMRRELTFFCLNVESKSVILASGQLQQDYLARQIYI